MCIVCHEESHDNPVSLDLVKASPEARAAEHGDGNPDCVRTVRTIDGNSFIGCMDCGEHPVQQDHCCYTDS